MAADASVAATVQGVLAWLSTFQLFVRYLQLCHQPSMPPLGLLLVLLLTPPEQTFLLKLAQPLPAI
jgi:hypothetical protein